eukprot:scaffold241_cov89-Cylindrotheca_fusiformis.AAC.13
MTIPRKHHRLLTTKTTTASRQQQQFLIAVFRFCLLSYVCHVSLAQPRQGNNVCIFDDKVFQPGESYGQLFEIPRCGAWYDFPCFCNLNYDPPVDCPYCAIVVQNDGLVCAREDERITIFNEEGTLQSCDCTSTDASTGGGSQQQQLQATCRDITPTNPPNFSPTDPPIAENDDDVGIDDVCTLDIEGTSQTFRDGESFGSALKTRCIDSANYPCFCDTSIPTKIRCPYCGYPTITGELICAEIDQTIQFLSAANEPTECTCLDDISSSSECRNLSEPTPQPTVTIPITSSPTTVPTSRPTTPEPTTSAPTRPTLTTPSPTVSEIPSVAPLPTTPWPTLGFDKPSFNMPNRIPDVEPTSPKPSPDGCFYNRKSDNSIGFVENGKSFGEDVIGPCPHDDFPVICNTRLTGKREYPYCVFSSQRAIDDGDISTQRGGISNRTRSSSTTTATETTCAASGSRVMISKRDGTRELCGCLYNNPAIGPVSQCKLIDFNFTEILPTAMPTFAPIENDDDDDDVGPSADPGPSSSVLSLRHRGLWMALCCIWTVWLQVGS